MGEEVVGELEQKLVGVPVVGVLSLYVLSIRAGVLSQHVWCIMLDILC